MNDIFESSFGSLNYSVDTSRPEGTFESSVILCPNCEIPMHVSQVFKGVSSPMQDESGATLVCSLCGSTAAVITIRKRLPIA